MKVLRSVVLPVLVLGLGAAPALAQGRFRDLSSLSASIGSGARALAMGGAFIALADPASASSWNPAGLCALDRPETSLVYQAVRKTSFGFATSDYGYSNPGYQDKETVFANALARSGHDLDFASISYPLRVGSLKLVPQLSYQRAVPFGGTRRDPNQRYTAHETLVDSAGSRSHTTEASYTSNATFSGGLDIYAASLGVSFTPRLYLGGSLNLWRKGSKGTRGVTGDGTTTNLFGVTLFPFHDTHTTPLDESFKGTNFSVGAIYRPTELFRLGAVFKSGFALAYTLNSADIFHTTTTNFTQTTVLSQKGDIHWPRTLGAGVAFIPKDVLTLSVDFTTTKWSDATFVFDETSRLTIPGGLDQTTFAHRTLTWPALSDRSEPEVAVVNAFQFDTQQVRFGTEYVLKAPKMAKLTALPVRAGVFTDRQLFKDSPNLGKITFLGFSAGLGLVWSHLTLDFAYIHESGSYRSRDYTYTDVSDGVPFTESEKGRADDTFHSNKFYVSSIIRF